MMTETIAKTDYKRMSIEAQFKGNSAPTQTSWKLLKDSERMTFDELMPLLSKTKKPVDKACICMNAVRKMQNGEQIAQLTLKIIKSRQPNKIINAIETAYPNNRMASTVVQLVASEATQHFLARLDAKTGRKTVEVEDAREESEDGPLRMEVSSMK